MSEVKRIEVYYNEWTDKFVVVVIPKDESFDTAFRMFDSFVEVEDLLEKFKKNFPDVEIKIYE